ncbi:protein spire homolog 2 isoform X2 [Stegostoma tigrinum]|uniref:protein spire homolog 2 isoform X2 n=1 Tax=Stegostoma tigrinum TaxID=3053191 RepID=UPI00202B9B2C|nr:protein spire homolog 2 isoform X2 [Stegostoma tigrinum]
MARSGTDGEPQQQVAGDGLEPQVLSLDEVLRAYEQPINEEQAWAVCYQCCRSLHRDWPREQVRIGRVRELAAILLHRDGTVSLCGEDQNRPPLTGSKANVSPRLCTEGQIVQSLGFAIYRALDWGLDENEERELSQQLEQLIDQMANNDSEGSNGTADEGYSGQDDEEEGDIPLRSVKTFEQVMKACAAHLLNRNEADSHFQAVCRALFVETLELRTFLVKIKDAKEMLKKMQFGDSETQQIPLVELDNLNHTDWARLWVQLMRDLRHGVKLKKVQEKQYNPLPTEYHLTPFEMLMQDIKARKYKLRKVMVDGDIPPCVKKNAHELILEFIRSRPPLKPVSERNLGPKPAKPRSLHERILEEIKSKKKLRPVRTAGQNKNREVTFGSLPCLVRACSEDLKSTSCIDLSVPESMGSTQRPRPRVLLKAPTLAEMDEMNISEEEESPSGEMRRVTSSPVPLKRDRSFSEHDLLHLQSELALSQSESAYLSKVSENETVLGTTPLHKRENTDTQPVNFQAIQSTRSCLVMGDNHQSVKGIPEALPTFSKRQWLEEFSHPVETLALTVEEVINVRKVLVKAEMEKFLPSKDLYNSLRKGKVCCCCKMKFPLFSWPSTCLFCKRSVCGSCNLKIKIPSKKFAHIPVYTVGFENIHGTAHDQGYFQSQSLKSLSNRSVEKEFPHLYTNGCSFKDICAECAKFVADVINSSRKSVDLLNNTPRRKVQSMYVHSTRS